MATGIVAKTKCLKRETAVVRRTCVVKLDVINPTHALHGGVSYFAFVCVCVSVTKISQKILNRSTSFLVEAFPVTQGGNHSILEKSPPGVTVGVGVKFDPNDKR